MYMKEKTAIAVLDAATLGSDIDLSVFSEFGSLTVYRTTSPAEVGRRASCADIIILNKVRINAGTLPDAGRLKLICIAATGFDNVDLAFCREKGIAVCNVVGYSTDSVAQLTAAMALYLYNRLPEFTRAVRDGSYTNGGVANMLTPVFRELRGKVWGIVGFGNIGRQVGRIASALGCEVIGFRRNPSGAGETDDLDLLLSRSDIISVHLPLSEATRGIIGAAAISRMKRGVILINTARGAVTDEKAVADAVLSGQIGGFGCDVYSTEPLSADNPISGIKGLDNVCLTPHNGWGAYEARVRCVNEMAENIRSFMSGGSRCRID